MPRFSLRAVCAALALVCSLGAPAVHAQTTLNFENLSNPNSGFINFQGSSVTQNGFTVTDTSPNAQGLYSNAPNSPFNNTGSVALFNNTTPGGITTVTQTNGNPFTLNSIDIANFLTQSQSPGGVTVVFTGNVQGGGVVTRTFTHGASDSLETVTFGSNFTNLASFSFAQNAPFNQFDNIVLNRTAVAVVPEPGSLALLAVGLLGTGGLAARRRRSTH